MYEKLDSAEVEKLIDDLPKPAGPYLLIAVPKVEEKTKGGIYRPDILKDREGMATIFGLVLDMGADAYQDHSRFPNGPRCKVGDWVMFRSYSGTKFKYDGREYRVIFDDGVEAIVPDPAKFERAA